jgi:hypothetical protein
MSDAIARPVRRTIPRTPAGPVHEAGGPEVIGEKTAMAAEANAVAALVIVPASDRVAPDGGLEYVSTASWSRVDVAVLVKFAQLVPGVHVAVAALACSRANAATAYPPAW